MSKFYYVTTYSFDASKPVTGPFNSEEETWTAMLANAQNEVEISKEDTSAASTMKADRDALEIELLDYWNSGEVDVTTYFIIEIPN